MLMDWTISNQFLIFSSSTLLGLVSHLSFKNTPLKISGVEVWWVCGLIKHQSARFWRFWQCGQELSRFKIKPVDQQQHARGQTQTITDGGNLTQPGVCVTSLFLQTLGSWFSNLIQNTFIKEGFGSLCRGPILLVFFSPGKTLETLLQKWLHMRNATAVATFLDTFVRGSTWGTDTRLSPLDLKFPQILCLKILSRIFTVISVAQATYFSTTFFLLTQLF